MPIVLIVEDDPDLAEVLGEFLEMTGRTSVVAASLADARERLPGDLAVALVDWTLPDADGREVVAWLRTASPSARIVVMTGHGERVAEGLGDAVDRVLAKPFRLPEVAALLDALA